MSPRMEVLGAMCEVQSLRFKRDREGLLTAEARVQMRFLGTDAVIANGTVDGVALTALNDGLTAMEMGVEFLPRLDGPGLGALGALIAMIKIEPRVAIFRVLGELQGELLDCEEAGR